jgi:hypothetical protein
MPLGEINADLRRFPPSHTAMTDGCLVEHEIKCIRNSNGTFHLEASPPVRKVADRTIDRCPVTFERDVRPLENAVTVRSSAILRGRFHRSILQSHDCIECQGDAAGRTAFIKSYQY